MVYIYTYRGLSKCLSNVCGTITSCAKYACVHSSFLVLEWQLVLLWCLLEDTNNTFYARELVVYNLFVNIVNLEYTYTSIRHEPNTAVKIYYIQN